MKSVGALNFFRYVTMRITDPTPLFFVCAGIVGLSGEWLVASKRSRQRGDSPSRPGRDRRRTRRAQRREERQEKIPSKLQIGEASGQPVAEDARGEEENPKWNDWSYQRRGGYPPVFADVGETKGLRENGLHQGETKDLAREKAKKKQRET